MELGGAHRLNLERSAREIGEGSTTHWYGQPPFSAFFGPDPPSSPNLSTAGSVGLYARFGKRTCMWSSWFGYGMTTLAEPRRSVA
jgi:hypothetical protein